MTTPSYGDSGHTWFRAPQLDPPLKEQRRGNVDFPVWMVQSLDREASRLGVTRQSIIKVWIAERLEQAGLKPCG